MFKIIVNLHGGGKGSTTQVQSYQPTDEEKRLQAMEANYSEAVAPNALYLNNKAKDLLTNSIGETQVDYNALNQSAQSQIANAQSGVSGLLQGQLPSAYQTNMENSIKSGVNNSVGSLLTSLGNRGVLNSSVTNTGIKGINDSAANAMTNAYSNNIGLLSQLYGQQVSNATSGITAGAAAQEAAQQPAINLWNASLGLNGATTGALSAISGQGTTTATTSNSGSGWLGGLFGSLANSAATYYGAYGAACFVDNTLIDTPNGAKLIKEIKKGDKVISPSTNGTDSVETVEETMEPRVSMVHEIMCNNGRDVKYVITTSTQPFMQEDGSFILVKDMKVDATHLRAVGIVKSIISMGLSDVYDLKVSGNNTYYADGFIAKGGTIEW